MTHYPLEKNISGIVFIGNKGNKLLSTENNFVYDSGNNRLGINVSNPQYTLDVSGIGAFSSIRFSDGTTQSTAVTAGGGSGNWIISVTGLTDIINSGETLTVTAVGSTSVNYNIGTKTLTVSGSDTNTTYLPGTGLNLSFTTFNVSGSTTFNSGIVQLQDTIQDNITNKAVTPNAVFDYVGSVSGVINDRLNLTGTNLTYFPGTGLKLSGTTFNVSGSTTSNSGIVQLQDSVQDSIIDRAVTPNAVFDYVGGVSGALDTRLNSTGNTLIGLINGKDNYQYWTLRGDSATTTEIQTTEQVQFTGAGNISVSLGGTGNRTVTISGTNAGSSSVVGPANTISFFSGNGALTGSSTLTYDPVKTSFTLSTQGDSPSTGFVILNNPSQSGNVFQIRSYIRNINSNTYNNEYISNTGDGSNTSNAGFQNASQNIELIYGTGTFATGFLPFNITGYLSGATVINDDAYITVYNANSMLSGTIVGSLALYTGDANPIIPTGISDIITQTTKLSEFYSFTISGTGSSSTLTQDIDLTPVLSRYFNLYPTNTGNFLFYYLVTPSTGSIVQNSIGSATNSNTGLAPKLNISFTTYQYAGTTTNKPIYSVDYIGRIKIGNIERSDQLINSFLLYASGEPGQQANVQIESPNSNARVLFTKNNAPLYSFGTVGSDGRLVIRDENKLTTPVQIFSQVENQGVITIRNGNLGVKTNTPGYPLVVGGGAWIRTLKLTNYTNVNQVPETTKTLYAVNSSLYWDGNLVTSGGPGGSYTWTVRDGSNNSETVADAMTVYWSGAGNVSTLYTPATNVMRISGSPGWNLGVGNESTSGVTNNSNITFTGLGNVTVTRNGGQISISGASSASSGGTSYDWKLSAGSETTTTITSGTNVSFTGFGNVFVTRNGNEIRISGSGASGQVGSTTGTYDWRLGVGSEPTTVITSGTSVTFSGTNGVTTTRSSNQINILGPHITFNSGTIPTNVTVNLNSGTLQTFTLTGNTTFAVTGVTPGARFMLRLQQGSAGTYTAGFNFPSGNIKWPGGSAPTISTGVGYATLVGFVVTSGTYFYDGFVIATGIR